MTLDERIERIGKIADHYSDMAEASIKLAFENIKVKWELQEQMRLFEETGDMYLGASGYLSGYRSQLELTKMYCRNCIEEINDTRYPSCDYTLMDSLSANYNNYMLTAMKIQGHINRAVNDKKDI